MYIFINRGIQYGKRNFLRIFDIKKIISGACEIERECRNIAGILKALRGGWTAL